METHQVVSLVTKSEAHVNKAALEKRYCKDRVEKNCFGFFLFFSNDDDGRVLGTCCPVVRYRHSDRSVEHSFCFFGRHTERERRVGWRGREREGRGVYVCAAGRQLRAGDARGTGRLLYPSHSSPSFFSLFSLFLSLFIPSLLSIQYFPSVRPSVLSPRVPNLSLYASNVSNSNKTKQKEKKERREEKRKDEGRHGASSNDLSTLTSRNT